MFLLLVYSFPICWFPPYMLSIFQISQLIFHSNIRGMYYYSCLVKEPTQEFIVYQIQSLGLNAGLSGSESSFSIALGSKSITGIYRI